jgi:catechol 2,3-dioxygenase-like lactoylglutathione lyase family enzyme
LQAVIDHLSIRVSDRPLSERFYNTVLAPLGMEQTAWGEGGVEWSDFSLAAAEPGKGLTRRLHVAFLARSRQDVERFWRAGTEAGFQNDGPPGLRPHYDVDYYGAFLRDPDGNSVEAVHRGRGRPGPFDHLWIRVMDVPRARRFYELIAPFSGYELDHAHEAFAHFVGDDASFSLVAGEPTEHMHLAFGASDNAVVEAFHRAAVAAGYPDNGPPREWSYGSGSYGAFVLDADGNNVEVVSHNR